MELSAGTCHYQNGNVYTGSWKAGMAYGTGTQTFVNGDRYKGEWKAGMMSGQVIKRTASHPQISLQVLYTRAC